MLSIHTGGAPLLMATVATARPGTATVGGMGETLPEPSQPSSKVAIASAILLLVAGGVFLGWLFVWHLVPRNAPVFKDPSFWDVLIDSRLMVGIVRLVALVLATYLVVSVIALMGARQWLIGFPGGMTTDKIDREKLRDQLATAEKKYADLATEYRIVIDLLGKAVEAQGVPPAGGGS
jgi:hypothetical protein